MALKEEAGWNQTEQDWLALFEFAPRGCFGIEIGGSLAATITVVTYESGLAWIGMVLTARRFQRQGLASALMRHTLDYLSLKPVDWIKLDATSIGQPLYERFGFEYECDIERWGRPGAPASVWFAEQSREMGFDSFACGRAGSAAAYFGPCRAASLGVAGELLEWFLALHPGEAIYWDLFPANASAIDLARSHGFTLLRKLVRMARRVRPGAPPMPTDVEHTYAIAGFEWG
jgi:GNAT superfamily N-acetyltransferase